MNFSHLSSLLNAEWDERPTRLMRECDCQRIEAEIAQMVERPSTNRKVSGSISALVIFSHSWL